MVQKTVICYYSPFFAAAFNSSFVEGNTESMDLDDVEPDVFALLVSWLYWGSVVISEGWFTSSFPNLSKQTAELTHWFRS